ncbi:hypothetical protein GCM10010112_09420 [Actinoplanes lobatus]|uniref:Cellulose synthase/poly-beta-1,6-N-acetylglucosamine synthase-like glycosyltransferase n=1 Tax=Actinoplanes lobatus TaxID=113568 RepID=A0A7W7HD90_9ACTN|nr:glycosyltransferase family 2 protein [Actinoplanes lobatus]MBB4748406.1 cellulose synthase/poly-beta-1,6-N-acetylglucosamine synthase-like glycosyltransferase [Actinoplanes lobatus]GGN57035.1 hypothetical protein GCM10010112_09420 [Actinoplanes lobatus]GIE37690.1 hypothetical protein Alo02nite_05880 [Actinoplanes lobatus]
MDSATLYEVIRNTTRLFAVLMLVKYTLFLLVSPFHHTKEAMRRLRVARKRRGVAYEPLVSLLVPAWNEEMGITATINSILENDYRNIEIVVVDDGSTDSTPELVRALVAAYEADHPNSTKSIRFLSKAKGGKGTALNYAVENARGEILVSVDADSIAHPHMVRNLVSYFADDTVDAVVGNVKVAGEVGFLNLLQKLEYLFGFYSKRAQSLLGAEYIYGGACAAFRRSTVFDAIGVFDTSSITEDIEMSLRTRFHGLKAVYADDAICYTEGAGTVMGLLKQRLRWKKGRFEAFGKYKKLFFSTRAQHSMWLTWFALPFAMLAELQLLFEPVGLTLLALYSYVTGDYSSLLLGALFIGILYVVVGLFTERARNWWIIPLFPFTWIIFYALVWIEYIALLKSISNSIRARGVEWQKWQRKGITVRPAQPVRETV